jgi:energy-converting hydrogenase Eha subunit C
MSWLALSILGSSNHMNLGMCSIMLFSDPIEKIGSISFLMSLKNSNYLSDSDNTECLPFLGKDHI